MGGAAFAAFFYIFSSCWGNHQDLMEGIVSAALEEIEASDGGLV